MSPQARRPCGIVLLVNALAFFLAGCATIGLWRDECERWRAWHAHTENAVPAPEAVAAEAEAETVMVKRCAGERSLPTVAKIALTPVALVADVALVFVWAWAETDPEKCETAPWAAGCS